MGYYCEVSDIFNKPKSKFKQFKSIIHNELHKCKHIKLRIENLDVDDINKAFYEYSIQHNKKYKYYLIKCEFKLSFNDDRCCPYITSKLTENKTMCSWQKFLVNAFNDLKNKGYNFNHIAEMKILKIVNGMDLSYDFYIKHNMPTDDWKLKAMINRNGHLIDKSNRIWRHPSIIKFEHVPISNE